MATAVLSHDALKDALKEALSETLHEHRDLFREVFEEVLEYFSLEKSIREGEDTEPVDRNQIMEILKESP